MLSRTGRVSRCVQGVVENHREGGGMMMLRAWRRLGVGLVTLVVIGSLAGALPARAAKVLTFAVVPKAINNPFFNDVHRGCEAEAKKLGVRCEYTGPTVTEIQPQIQQLLNSLPTKVPISSPNRTLWMLPSASMLNTTMGRLFSAQSAKAVMSITPSLCSRQ